jgi:adenine-specific DNA methylase
VLKRLIEVALPLKEISEHSAREKSIRHGHISTLHIWWARRPLAACRAAVFASLIPDPDDPECPEEFRKLVIDILSKRQFQPTNSEGSSIEDTLRNRCLEFIKYLVRWENSNNPDYIEPARKLIAAAHKFLHPDAEGDTPKVLDPFAGGGSIPLEALRLGCEAHAIDLNPVAHLIELCTLVYSQKYAQPDSRPVPDYIKRLIAHNQAKRKAKGEANLFSKDKAVISTDHEIIPDVEITEAEYRKNPMAADVKYWGHWVLKRATQDIGECYPSDTDGSIPGRHTLPMTWDFAETNPITGSSGNIEGAIAWVVSVIQTTAQASSQPAQVTRGMVQQLPFSGLEAVITDPPYYDAVP